MTAHATYELCVGEIGISRIEFLEVLTFWELCAIIRGYRKRERTLWHIARWQTFWLMHNGMLDTNKAGLHEEQDLALFPWEDEKAPELSDEEIEKIRNELKRLNENAERK